MGKTARTKLGTVLGLSVLLLAFQNCGKSLTPSSSDNVGAEQGKETIIGSTAAYKKIVYDPALESSRIPTTTHVELNLDDGSLTAILGGTTYQCIVDSSRLSVARSLIAISKLCKPGPLPPNMVSCMAIRLADVQLSNTTESVLLREVYCDNGTYLCDGNDEKLRSLIADLQANLPANCTTR